jgi:hypothetical protein
MIARMDVLDAEVLATLQDDIFRPAVVEEAIRLALEELSPRQTDKAWNRLEADRRTARLECERLAAAIEQGGPMTTLLERLQAAQGRLDGIDSQMRQCEARRVPDVDMGSLDARVRAKVADWRGLLHRNVAEARAVLRTLLIGPLRFTPVKEERRRGYAFAGALALDRMLAGVVDLPTVVASPIYASWNQLSQWLRAVDGLRRTA